MHVYVDALIPSQGKDASMGMAKGSQPLPFGHGAEAAVDIEGLSVSAHHLISNAKLIAATSCWKTIFKNSEKRILLLTELMMMKLPGMAGMSNLMLRRNLNP